MTIRECSRATTGCRGEDPELPGSTVSAGSSLRRFSARLAPEADPLFLYAYSPGTPFGEVRVRFPI